MDGNGRTNYQFDFDSVVPVEIPFVYKGVNYLLVEATEEAAVSFRNSQTRQTKLNPETKFVSVGDIADSEPYLVSLCLFKVDGEKRTPVPLPVVRTWPHKVIKKLFNTAKEISDLVDESPDEELDKQIETLQRRKADREQAKNS